MIDNQISSVEIYGMYSKSFMTLFFPPRQYVLGRDDIIVRRLRRPETSNAYKDNHFHVGYACVASYNKITAYLLVGVFEFHGISTFVGYSIPNPFLYK